MQGTPYSNRPDSGVRDVSTWSYGPDVAEPGFDLLDISDQIRRIRDTLPAPARDRLIPKKSAGEITAWVSVYLSTDDANTAARVDSDVLDWLSSLGLSLEFDIYFHG